MNFVAFLPETSQQMQLIHRAVLWNVLLVCLYKSSLTMELKGADHSRKHNMCIYSLLADSKVCKHAFFATH